MQLALTNVCFEGKNRHDAGVTPFPLMTRSGRLFALCSSLHAAAKPIPQLLRVINIFIAQSL
jgi:hypothetical protein